MVKNILHKWYKIYFTRGHNVLHYGTKYTAQWYKIYLTIRQNLLHYGTKKGMVLPTVLNMKI